MWARKHTPQDQPEHEALVGDRDRADEAVPVIQVALFLPPYVEWLLFPENVHEPISTSPKAHG